MLIDDSDYRSFVRKRNKLQKQIKAEFGKHNTNKMINVDYYTLRDLLEFITKIDEDLKQLTKIYWQIGQLNAVHQ